MQGREAKIRHRSACDYADWDTAHSAYSADTDVPVVTRLADNKEFGVQTWYRRWRTGYGQQREQVCFELLKIVNLESDNLLRVACDLLQFEVAEILSIHDADAHDLDVSQFQEVRLDDRLILTVRISVRYDHNNLKNGTS